jgi:hypothetical protein
MTYPAPPSHAHALAPQILVGRRITHGASIPPDRYNLALASLGAGLDHLAGEVAVALSEGLVHAEKLTHVALFTDRRMLARVGDVSAYIPYPGLTGARVSTGMLIDELLVDAHGRSFAFRNMPEAQVTASFLQALMGVHPGYRAPPPRPLTTPGPEDPTGGEAARNDLWSRDLRVLPLLGMAIEGRRLGSMPVEQGADLVARAMLFDRTLAYGRGAHEGWWTSPLGAPDLGYAFSRMLGAPFNWFQEGNTRVLDFRVGSGSNAGSAAASTAVGLVALGVLGVGWVSTPGKSLDIVRVKITPGNASTGFALFDRQAPLSQEWARFVAQLFEILPRIEGRMLIQRAAFGWDATPEQLDEISTEALFRKVAETIGEIDVGIFFPKPPPKR